MTAKTRKLGLTTSEAARHLGVSLSTIRRWSDMGYLRGYRTPGGQRRFSVEQLDAFLESLESSGPRRTPSPPEGEAEPRFAPEPDEPRGEPETEGEEPRFTVGDPAPVDDDPEPPAAA
jgi:excisionase family DNA binding protein